MGVFSLMERTLFPEKSFSLPSQSNVVIHVWIQAGGRSGQQDKDWQEALSEETQLASRSFPVFAKLQNMQIHLRPVNGTQPRTGRDWLGVPDTSPLVCSGVGEHVWIKWLGHIFNLKISEGMRPSPPKKNPCQQDLRWQLCNWFRGKMESASHIILGSVPGSWFSWLV